MIASHNPETQAKMITGEIAVELVPQGTLAERIRAAGAGLGGVLTPTGLGTMAADGKQIMRAGDRNYLLKTALGADVALIAARSADYLGNLVYSLTVRNRLMKVHGLLLEKHSGQRPGRSHDGKVVVMRSDLRWCSDGFEFTCWNGEIVRGAFVLDAHDREVIRWRATANAGISGSDIRDMMLETVEARFSGLRAPHPVEWLSDNGSIYTAARPAFSPRSSTSFPASRQWGAPKETA